MLGYAATVRGMYNFVKAKNYPLRRWLRPLALAFLRVGVRPSLLPDALKRVLGTGFLAKHQRPKRH